MVTKHFFKVLILFTGMILVGLLGVFLVSHFREGATQANVTESDCGTQNC